MTTIREAIDQLAMVARQLPAGLDSALEVVMCDGAGITSAPVAEIDTLAEISKSGRVERAWAIVKGHSHDEKATTARGIAEDADDELKRLTDPDQ